jgi:riboflavin kinase
MSADAPATTPAPLADKSSLSPPWRVRGTVVKGFARGSKLLGTPTANIDPAVFSDTIKDAPEGVYAAWAQLGDDGTGVVLPSVLSIGYNPQFENKERTCEVYILKEFADDFYGSTLGIVITTHLRPQRAYSGLEELKKAIWQDVDDGDACLKEPANAAYKTDAFFQPQTAATSSS